MQRKPKSNSVITTNVREGHIIEFTVLKAGPRNEHGQPTDVMLLLDMRNCSQEVRHAAMINGFIQRIVDRAALSRSTETGKSASPTDKLAAIRPLVEHYASGSKEWRLASTASGPRVRNLDPILLAAVCEATGRAEGELREIIERGAKAKGVTQDVYLAKLGQAEAVAPIVERLRAEAAQAMDDDSDELLAEAMGE